MVRLSFPKWTLWGVLACGLLATAVGCQSTVGGQTLPSAYYLSDDIQFHPAGPEQPLYNQIRVLEEYRREQQAIRDGVQPDSETP